MAGCRRRRGAAALLGIVALMSAAPAVALSSPTASPIRHVFVIVLENESAATTFSANPPAPFLATTMRSQGAFVPNYFGIGHASLGNYIAMISGQAPNPTTQSDCPTFGNFTPGTIGADGQAAGVGCVYPAAVPTLPDQLQAAGLTWRSYNESMGADPAREAATCGHPTVGAQDKTQTGQGPPSADAYATRHNPFVYFHSIIDNAGVCDRGVVNLSQLPQDLSTAASTPNLSFITPDLCSDGHDATCADPSRPGGYAGIDAFLSNWVPQVTRSPAFKQDGLLMVIFDEAGGGDASACCGEVPGPSSPLPGSTGPGGGVTGAVLLSPLIAPGTVTPTAYNHYSMLRSVEDIFGLPHLGYAGLPSVTPLGTDVFTNVPSPTPASTPGPPKCVAAKLPRARHGVLRANSVVAKLKLSRVRGRESLAFTARHGAALKLVLKPRSGGRTRTVRRGIRACRSVTILLPGGHFTVSLTASVGRAAQHATLRY